MAIEEAKFTILSKRENYDIRAYSKVLVAETVIDSNFDEAGSKAFRILADYIFGNNKAKVKISMTAPTQRDLARSAVLSFNLGQVLATL